MKKQIPFIIATALFLTSCWPFSDYECEIDDIVDVEIVIELDPTVATKPVEDIHLYGFDASDKLFVHKYFTTIEELVAESLPLDNGDFIFIAILNVGADFSPPESITSKQSEELPDLTLSDFIVWIKEVESEYPDMMSGMVEEGIGEDGTSSITIEITDGTDSIKSTLLRLAMTFPDVTLPDYISKFSTRVDAYNLRAVAEVYNKGTENRIHSYSKVLDNGTLDLNLQPGEYDILLWVDYTLLGNKADHHHNTSSLSGVTFNEQIEYTAWADSRDAFALKFEATVTDNISVTNKSITLERPLARYRIVATDVERYKDFIRINNYPPIEDLVVTISYEGYFPISYDINTGKPNNAEGGIKYSSPLKDITETTAMVGSDYVFVDDTESLVNTTITITNTGGKKIAEIKGVVINYRRGYLTTIEGAFLTAGIIDKGITIDTSWEGEYNVTF